MCHMSYITCHTSHVTCHMPLLHSSCTKVFKNIINVEYLIRIRFLLREGEIHPPSKPTKFLDVQANRVNGDCLVNEAFLGKIYACFFGQFILAKNLVVQKNVFFQICISHSSHIFAATKNKLGL